MFSLDSPIGFNGLPNMNRRLWTPSRVNSARLALNLNANASQMTLSGSTVSVWADQSGNVRDASHTGGADSGRLLYSSSGGPNGLPAVTNDATLRSLSFGNVFSSLTAAEIFVVRKSADPASGSIPARGGFWQFGTSGSPSLMPFSDGVVYDDFGSTTRKTVGNLAPVLSNWHIYNVITTSSEWTLNINGSQQFTTATNTVAFSTAASLGASINDGFSGGIAAIWMYDGKLSAQERLLVSRWLSNSYSLGLGI